MEKRIVKTLQPGLNAGDKFDDGGRIFVIEKVNQDGSYISHLFTAEEKKFEEEKKTKVTKTKKEEPGKTD